MQFIWTYFEGGAKGDEIRWSMRSIKSLFDGPKKFTIIGDCPSWYSGHYIPKPRIDEEKLHNFRDVISKIRHLSTHSEVQSRFIWMMDDVFLLNECTEEDLETPRATPEQHLTVRQKRKKWNRLKENTYAVLKERGLPAYDYATHLPHLIVKENLKKMFQIFDFENNTYLWEVLYENLYQTDVPLDCSPFLARSANPITRVEADLFQKSSIFLNCGNRRGWTQELRNWLQEKFPLAIEEEIE